jgi:hypothetical protein
MAGRYKCAFIALRNESRKEAPYETLTGVPMSPDMHNAHPFGCPIYVLNSKLQHGQKISKWDARANLGIYLGTSAIHASSVGLVLSLRTGLVSPIFHNAFDDAFVTVSSSFAKYLPKSNWQVKCGFQEDPNLMNLTMQPLSSQTSRLTNVIPTTSTPDNIQNETNNTQNNKSYDEHIVSERGGDYYNNIQQIKGIFEGGDTSETGIQNTQKNMQQDMSSTKKTEEQGIK